MQTENGGLSNQVLHAATHGMVIAVRTVVLQGGSHTARSNHKKHWTD